MVKVEICISADSPGEARGNARSASEGGADRIEVCAGMSFGGLTPDLASIEAAREAFGKEGLVVMIRPEKGDFTVSREQLEVMRVSIEDAARAGADGVVFGVLRKEDGRLDRPGVGMLVETALRLELDVTFHRAIDATPDPLEALGECVDIGVDRVLTAGSAWRSPNGHHRDIDLLVKMVSKAAGQLEIVVGGGVDHHNAVDIVRSLSPAGADISMHAWSSVLSGGVTSGEQVARFVEAVRSASTGR